MGDHIWHGGTSYGAVDGPRGTIFVAIHGLGGGHLCCHGWSWGTTFGGDQFLCDRSDTVGRRHPFMITSGHFETFASN